jgi:DNA-directed RNA polymerase specialized sigma24 family protein
MTRDKRRTRTSGAREGRRNSSAPVSLDWRTGRRDDEAILRAVRDHQPGAFDRFVERFGNRIYAFSMRSCGHREDAEDVFQGKFAPDQELSLDELLPLGEIETGPVLPRRHGPEGELYRRRVAEEMEEAVHALPPAYRIIWMLRDVEGLDTAETARALEISEANVKMRLHRARLALRKRLAHLHPEEGET